MPIARSLLPAPVLAPLTLATFTLTTFTLATLTLATLTACGSSSTSATSSTGSTSVKDALYFPSSNIPVGYVGEAYTATLQVAGGVGPYSLRLASGTLPTGLTLNNTTLSGKPTTPGLYTFTLEASDASLSTKSQTVSLTVAALPPLALAFTLPPGEIRGETRLPLTVTAPRGLRAFRLQWALPTGVTVTRVTPVDTRAVAYWKMTGGLLTLDMGFRAAVASGDRLALVTVQPSGPVTLQSPAMGFRALGGDGTVLQTQALPGTATPPTATPSTGLPSTGTPSTGTTVPAGTTPAATPPSTTTPSTDAPASGTPTATPATTTPATTPPATTPPSGNK